MPLDAYYNEHDPEAAATLRELIARGLIAPGEVDERDIRDVRPDELSKFAQCHFFAGIGGWSLALRLAGWPDDLPVWTGSCPCQPFSAAGRGLGFMDERHLWPAWQYLIAQRRPAIVFGEQVSSTSALSWLDLVSHDLERIDYAIGASDICAASVGAPHPRQRIYFCALGNADRARGSIRLSKALVGKIRDAKIRDDASCRFSRSISRRSYSAGMVDHLSGAVFRRASDIRPDSLWNFWNNADWISCRDGKFRPLEPGAFPLAHGISYRLGILRGYGNAIVPQVAQAFIESAVAAILETWERIGVQT